MKSSKQKKLCAVLIAATLSTTLLFGCGSNTPSKEEDSAKQETQSTGNKDTK